jgi:hypothetical protein
MKGVEEFFVAVLGLTAIVGILWLFGTLLWMGITRGNCVERAPFMVGAPVLIAVEGSYCSRWEN